MPAKWIDEAAYHRQIGVLLHSNLVWSYVDCLRTHLIAKKEPLLAIEFSLVGKLGGADLYILQDKAGYDVVTRVRGR